MNDDFLSRFRRDPSQEFADALYNRISQRTTKLLYRPSFRLIAISAFSLMIILVILLSFPEVRAYAELVLRYFTQAESSSFPLPLEDVPYQVAIPAEHKCDDSNSMNYYQCEVNKAELSVGFDIRELSRIPDGLTFSKVEAYPSEQAVTITYECNGCRLRIIQIRSNGIEDVWPSPWSEVPVDVVEHVLVNGHPGKYVQGRFVSVDGTSAYWEPDSPSQRLRWREGEMSFEISLDGHTGPVEYLVRDSIISLAESMK